MGRAAVALARLEQSAHAPAAARARSGASAAGLDPRISGLGVDHDPFAMDDVLTLTDHDIAAQRNRFGLEVVNAEIAARDLILGEEGQGAARFNGAASLRAMRFYRRTLGVRA